LGSAVKGSASSLLGDPAVPGRRTGVRNDGDVEAIIGIPPPPDGDDDDDDGDNNVNDVDGDNVLTDTNGTDD
jgi:hypothetical protein